MIKCLFILIFVGHTANVAGKQIPSTNYVYEARTYLLDPSSDRASLIFSATELAVTMGDANSAARPSNQLPAAVAE